MFYKAMRLRKNRFALLDLAAMKRTFSVCTLLLSGFPLFSTAHDLLSAEAIVSQLTAQPAPSYRSMTKAPDPNNHLCGNLVTILPTMQKSFRNLYVEASPATNLNVTFDFGNANLLPEGKRQLDELAKALKSTALAQEKFTIAGHTDAQGTAEFNGKLSCARALTARDYLIKTHRISFDRLIPLGFGMEILRNPADPAASENRRVEVRFLPK